MHVPSARHIRVTRVTYAQTLQCKEEPAGPFLCTVTKVFLTLCCFCSEIDTGL